MISFYSYLDHRDLHSFPTRRSSDLGQATLAAQAGGQGAGLAGAMSVSPGVWVYQITDDGLAAELTEKSTEYYRDRKSTRLNSSHGYISYAFFCLKKKNYYYHYQMIS